MNTTGVMHRVFFLPQGKPRWVIVSCADCAWREIVHGSLIATRDYTVPRTCTKKAP